MNLARDRDGSVEDIEHIAIPMPDGTMLSARAWLPAAAHNRPVPALFEYIPYRKRDLVRERDERNHPVFAAAGYACLRVDMRGSGDSEGRMSDMYGENELADARHVIAWIAAQPWCDGSVGMFGTSWGGTASLQACIDAPAPLKAVIAVCATVDRYETDIHHMGGLVLSDSVEWGATFPAILALPPSEAAFGSRWFDVWRERLDDLSFPLEHWIAEETRTPYWKHGSISGQADRIGCPVLAIGGWSDSYANSVMALIERNPKSVWGIVGPWGHHYPDRGSPGPAMGFQDEALAWFDHWLRPTRKDASDEPCPRLRVWMGSFDPPADWQERRSGTWISLDGPPSSSTRPERLFPSEGRLGDAKRSTAPAPVPFDLRVGEAAGDTGYFGRFGGLPLDQGIDDARSLVFDSAPLTHAVQLVGRADVRIRFTCDRPLAQIAVRLSDVAPDGQVNRVSLAVRNLAIEDGLEEPRRLEPGRSYEAVIPFQMAAYRFDAGHGIRLAISASYWPITLPAPEPTAILIDTSASELRFPVLAPEATVSGSVAPASTPKPNATIRHLIEPSLERLPVSSQGGVLRSGWRQNFSEWAVHTTAARFGGETHADYQVEVTNPASATASFVHRFVSETGSGRCEVSSRASVAADAEAYTVNGRLTATWNGERLFERTWHKTPKRRV